MIVIRAVLLLAGLALTWFGISHLLDLSPTDLTSVAIWFAAGILLHDALFAPLCAALGVTARHILPAAWWAVTACAAVCSAALLLVSVPVLTRENARPDNPTVLDRNYPLGLTIALALIWIAALVIHLTRTKNSRRR